MVTTFCQSGAVLLKAGKNVNYEISGADLIGDTEYIVDEWIQDAESTINALCRNNYVSSFSTLTTAKKLILRDIASSLAAINVIAYDMSGYTSRIEAEDMINVLRDSALRGLSILRDKKNQDFIDAT